jgi:hypothetical protein
MQNRVLAIQAAVVQASTDNVLLEICKYLCSMATKFTESHFKILGQGINGSNSMDTWKWNADPSL